jgi:predicted PurR-regulated permease PerM
MLKVTAIAHGPVFRGNPYNKVMMNGKEASQSLLPEKTIRLMLSIASTILMLGGLTLLIQYFYAITALMGGVLIVTYILIGPVNLLEKVILACSRLGHQQPLYRFITQRSPEANPRILAVLIVYAVVLIGLTVGGIRFLPILAVQLGDLGQRLGVQAMEASDSAIDWVDHNIGQGTLRNVFKTDIQQAERQGVLKHHSDAGKPVSVEEKTVIQQSVIQNAVSQLENFLISAIPNLISVATGTVNGIIYFLAGLILTFYFLIDANRIKQAFLRIIPLPGRPTLGYLLETFHQVMFAFVKGQVLLGILTGFYMFLVYSIFHVPYAFLLGSIFAVAELLPVVGTWIGIGIGLTVILLNMDPATALYVWACSYAYQTVKDNILAPKVVGDVMGLHPMVILLALLICAQVAGLLGVLLALPLASALNVIIRLLLENDAKASQGANPKPSGGDTHVHAHNA